MQALTVKINGDNSGLKNAVNGAQKVVIGFGTILKGVLASRAISAAINAIGSPFERMQKVFDKGGQLADVSARTGQTAEAIYQMSAAFEDGGSSADKVGPAINRLQKALAGVNEDGEPTNKTFEKLGLSIDALKGMSAPEQFAAIAKRLNEIQDPAEKAATAMGIWGKSGAELLSVFADPDAFSAPLKNYQALLAKNAGLFDNVGDTMARVRDQATGLWVGIGDKLAPVILPILERLEQFDFAEMGQRIGEVASFIVQAFADGKVTEIIGGVVTLGFQRAMNFITGAFGGLVKGLVEYIIQGFGLAVKVLQIAGKAEFWAGLLNALVGAAQEFGAVLLDGVARLIEALSGIPLIGDKLAGGAASVRQTAADMRARGNENLARGGDLLGPLLADIRSQMGDAAVSIAQAVMQGAKDGQFFDTESTETALTEIISGVMENVAKAQEAARPDPKGVIDSTTGLPSGRASGIITTSLGRIGGASGAGSIMSAQLGVARESAATLKRIEQKVGQRPVAPAPVWS